MGIEQKPPPCGEEHEKRPVQVSRYRTDIVAFIEALGPEPIELTAWQRELLRNLARVPPKRALYRGGRRVGGW